ncbi:MULTISPECIES: hypothetical protein [unclassified Neisseria]|uniref:hypothetical protein n=1 Tax=unclassified Neisseria TaxID=2623750 RepID=UPI00266540B2|nr:MULTISPECIES: hypothetical protein [unclassified Neisseria]MDO1510169.1 hypothetical protein [Neisseria sp. MVDL19-042950]MDO1516745.1 hypothetical protein [Neisseria sp. MVDL18-041461]MDO1563892.1 hypothetical protein [Neisseria sp. MVDL20-010259]
MKYISINKWPVSNYQKLKRIWNENSIVSLEVGEISFYDDMVSFLINEKDEFAFAILSELAEKDNVPVEILEKIFYTGNLSCQMSVCKNKNLPHSLKYECMKICN